MKVIFVGPPGSGKTTQSIKLSERFGISRASSGEFFRKYFRTNTEFQRYRKDDFDRGILCNDEVINSFVREQMINHPNERQMLDGYPRTKHQASYFDNLMRKRRERYAVINFNLGDETLVKRLLGRNENREDDVETVIRRRIEVFKHNALDMIPVLMGNGLFLDVDGSLNEGSVYSILLGYLEPLLENDRSS